MDAVLEPGETCGGNEVIRLLGFGGFAQVYEVRDRTGARRALKILDAEADAKPKLRARLAQEGAALARLDHTNVVRLFEAGVDGERVYLLLELVEGKNLREILHAAGRLPVETAVRWIRQAAMGIGEAHRRQIIHRDLKPENLLVTPQEVIKVIDFGVSKLAGLGIRTSNDQKLGTAFYMSPEHIRGAQPDPRMDVYALGLMLYEAIAGAHPIGPYSSNAFQVCARQLTLRPRHLAEAAGGVPAALDEIVARAIEKDPALRFPDAVTLAEALHGVLLALGEEKLSALRGIVGTVAGPAQPRAPLARTVPWAGVPQAITQPMSAAPSDDGRGSVSVPPAVRAAPRARPPAPPIVVVTLLGVGLGIACGVGLAWWVIPWPF
jgi:eukaryotic-like serine/threonine-protein kinase